MNYSLFSSVPLCFICLFGMFISCIKFGTWNLDDGL